MYSTSELGDSRKELRQVECCVHGRPCIIASKLSQRKKITNHGSSLNSYDLIDSAHRIVSEKSEPQMRNDISYNLDRKVEREALDVPIRKWNFRRCSSSSSLSSESIGKLIETEDVKPLPKDKHIRHKMECQSLSRNLNKSSSVGHMKQRIFSQERCNEYEMMRPTDLSIDQAQVAQVPMSAEETLWTAPAIHDSMEISPSMEAYIGIMSANQAENSVFKPASFKLYHMMPKIDSLNNILPSLGLYIIYRSSKGHAFHYPIKQRKQYVDHSKTKSKLTTLNNLRVEYGDPLAPWFFTLDALVSYYNVYVHLHEIDGECVADIFPIDRSKSYHDAASLFD